MSSNEDSYDNLVIILPLLCLLTILSRHKQVSFYSPTAVPSAPSSQNALQKLVGDLAKGDGAPSAETLISLLGLLNNFGGTTNK